MVLAFVTYHEADVLGFEQVSLISLKVNGAPELPIFNQLGKADIDAYYQ